MVTQSRWSDLDGRTHWLDVGGPVDAPPIVAVHGLGGSHTNWLAVAPDLATDHRVYALDLAGHGHTPTEQRGTDVVANERLLHRFIVEVVGQPVTLLGNSMGGLLSSRFAQRHPGSLAGLVLCGAVVGDWTWARDVLQEDEMPPPPDDWSGMSRDPQTVHEYATDPLVYRDTYKRPLLEAEVIALDRFTEQIGLVDIPVLFLHGDEDPFVPYRTSLAAAKAFPTYDLTVRVYPGARHEVLNEINRSEVIAEVADFCTRVAP